MPPSRARRSRRTTEQPGQPRIFGRVVRQWTVLLVQGIEQRGQSLGPTALLDQNPAGTVELGRDAACRFQLRHTLLVDGDRHLSLASHTLILPMYGSARNGG